MLLVTLPMPTRARARAHTHTHTHTHTRAHIHARTHTHAHTTHTGSGDLTKGPLVMPMDEEDWTDSIDGLGLGWGMSEPPTEKELACFSAAYDVTLMNPAMRLNMLSR